MRVASDAIFSQEQKIAKVEITKILMDSYFDSVLERSDLFKKPQELSDLCTSLFIVFFREMLVHYLHTFNIEHERKKIMKVLFEEIKEQVNNEIKKSMM